MLNMKTIVLWIMMCLTISTKLSAKEEDLLQKLVPTGNLKGYILNNNEWIKYPAYNDRQAWVKLTGPLNKRLIEEGEQFLNYEWKVVKATDYLEFERTGNREVMQNPFGDNNRALITLIFAELAEGKGRFMDQVINGVWQTCNMPSWVLSAHLIKQKTKRTIPDFREQIIDLTSGDIGSLLSWSWYFFNKEWDKTDPIISQYVKKSVTERILEPYLNRSDFWWQAFSGVKGAMVNNWNPWCNFNVLTCYLLMEDDEAKKLAGIYKTMQSVDKYINYVKHDGACEEGPSYWRHSAGKLYDYLQILYNASGGKINMFSFPAVKKMGEYIARSYVGKNWVVNFADASAKEKEDYGLVYRYGKAVNSTDMKQFAAYLFANSNKDEVIVRERDFFRAIEFLDNYEALIKEPASVSKTPLTWYPETEYCFIKNTNGLFFATKGGFNNESHNHNDVGTFNLYVDTLPVIIDVGVETYTKQTFNTDRYKIWTMQSDYHNLPVINGVSQKNGAEYKATNTILNEKEKSFSVDIAGAYPTNAAVRSWNRKYTVKPNGITITDHYELLKFEKPAIQHFMTWASPELVMPGKIALKKDGVNVYLNYEKDKFDAAFEKIDLKDIRLTRIWGDTIYRIKLTAKNNDLKGKYSFSVTR